jgi:hypothetical protein
MEFLKKHYEKLILSVVLLGLAAVAVTLPLKVNEEKAKEDQRKETLINPTIKPYPPIDLATNQQILAKVKSPIKFDIAGKHNLFNPVPWTERPNGELVKMQGNVGLDAMEVTAINPLRMIMSLDNVVPVAGVGGAQEFKYEVTVVREGAARNPKQGRAMSKGMNAPGIGTLRDVQGPSDNPTGLVIALDNSSRTQVVISKEKPYSDIIGYAADLKCTLPPLDRKGAKMGDTIILGTDVYTVRTIDKDSVTLQDKRTQKTFTKKIVSAT